MINTRFAAVTVGFVEETVGIEQQALATALGRVIRRTRRAAGLTLKQVAATTGVSQPFLSQAETGRSLPSVMTLHRIAAGLGTSAHALLAQAHADQSHEPSRVAQEALPLADGVTVRFLASGRHDVGINEVNAAPGSDPGAHTTHDGDEVIYVAEGAIRVVVGEAPPVDLGPGGSIQYSALTPHRWSNPFAQRARFLIISSPSSF